MQRTPAVDRRGVVWWLLTGLLVSIAAFGAFPLTGVLGADAANCHRGRSCASSTVYAGTPAAPGIPRRRFRATPSPTSPTSAASTTTTSTSTTTTTTTVPAVRAAAAPTTMCARIIAGIVWPPEWRVQCADPRPGLLGLTDRDGLTTLFVRTDQTMTWLHVIALHEAGQAWDVARLHAAEIARWCAVRGCDPLQFFSGGVSGTGWHAPAGAEDWAAAWDACHGGEYHRSYLGLPAPPPAQCALQDSLVGYPG